MNTTLTRAEKSIFIEGRLWFDKGYGNTYFSNRVWVDGKVVFQMGMEYGYDRHYEAQALRELVKRGYIESDNYRDLEDKGINFYSVAIYGTKRELFKAMN